MLIAAVPGPVATGYVGPAAPSWPQVLVVGEFHLVPTVLIVLMGGWYAYRVRRLRGDGRQWPRRRSAYWFLGLGSYALVTMSAVGVYEEGLFSVRSVQVATLLMITPQLWAHALPGTLARETATSRGRRVSSVVLHARFTQWITHPVVGVVLLTGFPIALYGSGWFAVSLSRHLADEATQLAMLACGFHYFWTRLQRDPVPRLYPQVVTVVLTMVDIAVFSVVPLALIVSPTVVAESYYTGLGRRWGLSLPDDQDFGAGILWSLADLACLPFLLLALAQWVRRDEADAIEIDRHLDDLGSHPAPNDTEHEPGERRALWWKNDPALSEHYHWYRRD